ncbi:MAG: hypothetical protein UW11_C0037G0005 [Parcubacteria group bacterium GW2011_GWA2_43_9b]|nr:MAG: hypothetical protein UW11_C0037G0005 [Parcubacteria group bacterium GW2011_GWA2_43_9b]
MLSINKENYHWTDHVKMKMRQYGLSESRVKRVLRYPKRLEVGVAEDTVAGMQTAGSKKHPFEIWVMWVQGSKGRIANSKSQINSPHPNPPLQKGREKFKIGGQKIIIISAWRYPGISPLREPPPIPDDVWEALRKMKKS